MDVLSRFLVKRILREAEPPFDLETRVKCAVFQGTVSIILNLGLAIIKLIFGWLTNSIALLADAFHTASDVVTSAVVILGFKMARKPADVKHPYGHGRIEPIATLVIALLLIWAGIEFAHASYDRLREPPRIGWSTLAFSLMILSTILKEWMARFALSVSELIASDMLKADAWHHRSDAAASAFVAVSLVAAAFGYNRIDSIFGFGVAGLIIYTGFDMLRSMVNVLLGEAPPRDLVDRIVEAGLSVKGVEEVHDINVHDYGHRKIISLHIVIPGEIETARSHHLAKLVEKAVSESANVAAVVHVDPSSDSESESARKTVEMALQKIVQSHPGIEHFEGLRMSPSKEGSIIEYRIFMNPKLSLERAYEIGREVARDLRRSVGDCRVDFRIEPGHGSIRP